MPEFSPALLEFLRFQQRGNQVSKQEQGCDSRNEVIHGVLLFLQAITRLGEEPAEYEKDKGGQNVQQIGHGDCQTSGERLESQQNRIPTLTLWTRT